MVYFERFVSSRSAAYHSTSQTHSQMSKNECNAVGMPLAHVAKPLYLDAIAREMECTATRDFPSLATRSELSRY
jgi:hypothetical protein